MMSHRAIVRMMVAGLCMMIMPLMAKGQDIHFSQVDADPMLLNPAYAGFYQGAGRFGVVYRNQWASVSVPYQTVALTGEIGVWRDKRQARGLSVGFAFFGDHAGTLNYGTTSGHLSAAYYHALSRSGNNYISVGLEGGFAIAGYDPSMADMDDPSEVFALQQVNYPLLAAGLAWYYQPSPDLHIKTGVSIRNINRPNISYLGLDSTFLHRRYSVYARLEYRPWQYVSLMPVTMMQWQGKHQELVYGMDVKWYLEEGGAHEISLRAGLAMRHADAVIATLMMEYDALLFSFCYDANVSGLAAASNTFGAIEIGLVYRLPEGKKKQKAIKCPMY